MTLQTQDAALTASPSLGAREGAVHVDDSPAQALLKPRDGADKAALKERKRLASLDRRRRRNREAMQRARQRDKDHMEALRDEARALEQTHRALVDKLDAELGNVSGLAASELPASRAVELQARLQDAREQASALMTQNLAFQEQLGERVKGEDRMEGLLKELRREQQVQEQVYRRLAHDALSPLLLRATFTEERAMQVIIRSRQDRRAVDKVGFLGAQRIELFGWSTLHRFHEGNLYFSFKKLFRNRSAAHMVARNWANEIKFVTYRSATEAATQQYYVVRKVNDDTYLIAREKQDPDNEGGFVRLLYLRFRIVEPDGSYAVVTQSVPQARALYGRSLDKIWANTCSMWGHFVPVVGDDGEEHCEIHMAGVSAVGDPRGVRTNVLETILGLLRWENINVGPTLSLKSSDAPPEQQPKATQQRAEEKAKPRAPDS